MIPVVSLLLVLGISMTDSELEERVGDRPELLEAMRAHLREAWPTFRYRSLAAPVRDHLRLGFPLAPADLDALAERYVEPLAARN
jgi:hypothetical protein